MMTEKGVLIFGLDFEGKTHKEFELRLQLVSDSVDALEEYQRAVRNDSFMGLCVLAKQLLSLGEIPKAKITPMLLMQLTEADLGEITEASKRLHAAVARFRNKDKAAEKGHAGLKEAGV